MPILQAVGSFSTGRDTTVIIQGPFGRVTLPNVTGFKTEQVTTNLKSRLLNGNRLAVEIPDGWTGTIDMDRGSNDVEELFSQVEAAWYLNGVIYASEIYQYITETNGSQITWQYTQCSLKLTDAGQWRGDEIVKQTISFEAFRRQAV